ncbi:hypothetical protein [uncultured Psychrobacter sp.]|uniref:hypothetical protein n=1 Tax=uncultured Psychrobacter sp. TaxID=259303 RepID=UPI0030DD6381
MKTYTDQVSANTPTNPNIKDAGQEECYDVNRTYELAQTSEQFSFVRIVMKLGPTLDRMLYMALVACFLGSILLYHAGFESPALLKHQMVIVGLLILVQSSVAANTFIIKQTVVNGNFTPALQISTLPDEENPTPRGHLLFLNSLYKGSLYVTLFLTVVFTVFMVYSVYRVGSSFDFITIACLAGVIALNALSTATAFWQQKKVAKLLIATSVSD